MPTLALYVGLSDAHGRPLRRTQQERLTRAVVDAIDATGAPIYAHGILTGEDETGQSEQSAHYLIDVPPSASLLALFRTIAAAVERSGQRSFGVVGWGPGTIAPASDAIDLWYRQGWQNRGGHSA